MGPPEGRWFGSVTAAARIDNGVGLGNDEQGNDEQGNDEQGRTVWVATDRRVPWTEVWPQLRRPG